jgi:hypothetical protein
MLVRRGAERLQDQGNPKDRLAAVRGSCPISPFVGFQYATVETLERFSWWRFLRNRRRTEADKHDQE